MAIRAHRCRRRIILSGIVFFTAITGSGQSLHLHAPSRTLAASADQTIARLSEGNVAFANVQGVFKRECARCHQGAEAPAQLVLVEGQAYGNIVNVPSTEYPPWLRVHPGDRSASWLYEKITNPNPPVGSKMENLSADEIELIGKWIDQGATEEPAPPYAGLEFRTAALPIAEINVAYRVELVVWGGLPDYTFDIVAGSLPPGCNFDEAHGEILGSPTVEGQYDFTVRVRDRQMPAATREQAYTLEVRATQAHWQLPADFEIRPVVTDLDLPVNIAFVPNPGTNPDDPYFYVTQLYGQVVMVQRDFQKSVYADHLLNFDPRNQPGFDELGVEGVAVDPETGDVFATAIYIESGLKLGKVVRFHSNDGGKTAATQTTIFPDIPVAPSHSLHTLTLGPDRKLYLNAGDGQIPNAAQDMNDLRGKILRMNLDGSLPDDNPFPGSYTYAYGFRNPFGAAWRKADSTLYISDNGAGSDDRLAKVLSGGNYGWPNNLTSGAIYLWNPTVAPVAVDFLRDTPFPPEYAGQLFAALSGETYLLGASSTGKKIQSFQLDAGGQVLSDAVFLDYIGAGYATIIGLAFGPEGLYFTDLYGENGFDAAGFTHANVYRIRWVPQDTAAPVISGVEASAVTAVSARIVWQTNEPSSSQVEYGRDAAYGSLSTLSTNLTAAHGVTLTDLQPQTSYHYRVKSRDAAGNLAVSDDFTFTTTPTNSILFADDFNTATLDLNKWRKGTNRGNLTHVVNDQLELHAQFLQTDWLTANKIDTARNAAVSINITPAEGGGNSGRLPAYMSSATIGSFDLNPWPEDKDRGDHSDDVKQTLGRRLTLAPTAWIVTKQKYAARNTTVTVKVVQPNSSGDLGMTPTYQASSAGGIFNQANWYRFYVYREANAGPYRLYVQWRKNTAVGGLEVTGNLVITGAVYLRLRFDDSRIYFEASLDGQNWTETYNEPFALPGHTLDSAFHYELAAYWTELKGRLLADDFKIATSSSALAKSGEEEAAQPTPMIFALSQNYPNPFHANTHVRVALPEEAQVHAAIYDIMGKEVQHLHQQHVPPGYHIFNWDGANAAGEPVSSGIYFLCVIFETAGGRREVMTRQLRLMR